MLVGGTWVDNGNGTVQLLGATYADDGTGSACSLTGQSATGLDGAGITFSNTCGAGEIVDDNGYCDLQLNTGANTIFGSVASSAGPVVDTAFEATGVVVAAPIVATTVPAQGLTILGPSAGAIGGVFSSGYQQIAGIVGAAGQHPCDAG